MRRAGGFATTEHGDIKFGEQSASSRMMVPRRSTMCHPKIARPGAKWFLQRRPPSLTQHSSFRTSAQDRRNGTPSSFPQYGSVSGKTAQP